MDNEAQLFVGLGRDWIERGGAFVGPGCLFSKIGQAFYKISKKVTPAGLAQIPSPIGPDTALQQRVASKSPIF
jgi:hypothetical protein